MYLHEHDDFVDLIRIVADERKVLPELVEKDYWVTRALHGLSRQEFNFEIKGGTSLSKGYALINRFSEDIDMKIDPLSMDIPFEVNTNPKRTKPQHVQSRKDFYDWLANAIKIDGFVSVVRDDEFDNNKYTSGGIRLIYDAYFGSNPALKEGVLLELGFDDTEPAQSKPVSSWAAERALESGIDFEDSEPAIIKCYHPGYTLVEKLQAVSTKYRKWELDKKFPPNFLRHYYDIYCLLESDDVKDFIKTDKYVERKEKRFPTKDNKEINQNPAFLLSDKATRGIFEREYVSKADLYFGDQVPFGEIMERMSAFVDEL